MIDGHPPCGSGCARRSQDGYEVEETRAAARRVDLVLDVGDFDVASSTCAGAATDAGALGGTGTIRALRKAQPGLGIVAHGERAERHLANSRLQAGATAYVARTAGAEQLSGRRRRPAQERFVDPAARPPGSRGAHPAPARDPAAFAERRIDGTVAARLGLSAETVRTHTKAFSPGGRPRPRPRGRDRPARVADRVDPPHPG